MVDYINTQTAYAPKDVAKDKENSDPNVDSEFEFFGEDGMSFLDFVDIINPLQHIPVVSTAYRAITGDELDPGARLAGGTLYGGPIGLAASAFNVILEHNTGKDSGEHILALFEGDEVDAPNDTQFAKNDPNTNTIAASFAPLPEEDAAFAAGNASLRMADLHEFMSPNAATQIPIDPSRGTGSVGTWAPTNVKASPLSSEKPDSPILNTAQPAQVQAFTAPVTKPKQDFGFKAVQAHDESVSSALQAFARDMQIQKSQKTEPTPQMPPVTTSGLAQTQSNGWFTDMMSQNLERHTPAVPRNPQS